MGEVIVLQNKSHVKDLGEGLWNLFQDNYKTDVTLSFQDNGINKVVAFHHLILATFSPTFRDFESLSFIFKGESGFTEEDVVKVLEFMYLGQIRVTVDSLPRLKAAAESMAVEKLILLLQQHECVLNDDSKLEIETEDVNLDSSTTCIYEEVAMKNSSDTCQILSKNEVESRIAKQPLNKFTSDHNYEDPDSKKTRKSKRILKNKNVEKYDDQIKIKSGKSLTLKTKKKGTKKKGKKQLHRCPQCLYETAIPYQLRSHLASIHQMDEEGNVLPKSFQCNECDYVCASNVQLRKHNFNKHSVRKHICSECGYATVNKTTLRIHFNGKHGSEKVNKCKYCDYTSRYRSTLYQHMETHTEDRPICEVCGKTFLTPAYLRAHKITHNTGPKPFSCHLCEFTSLSRYRLRMHHHKVHKNIFSSTEEFVNWYQQFQSKS